jgi:hypothetical protein
MDFSKICRFVDQLNVDNHSIFHMYSKEVMTILVEYKSPPGEIVENRCSGSDMLVSKGFTPSEAIFIMEWSNCKKAWCEFDIRRYSTDEQFEWLRRYLRNMTTFDICNYEIFICLCNLSRICGKSEHINTIYPSWRINVCRWDLLANAQKVELTPIKLNAQSLQKLCVKKCVTSGIALTNEYKMFRGEEYWWWTETKRADRYTLYFH